MKTREKALEAYLVAAARTGDRASLARLISLRGPRLTAHAVRLLGESEGAADLVQDSWVEIIRSLRGLRDETVFLPWALRIVSRRVARRIKGYQRDREIGRSYLADAPTVEGETASEAADAPAVRKAVAALPPDHRATVALFYLEDMSVSEVAAAMDVPVGTVKTRLMHARARLRAYFEGDDNG